MGFRETINLLNASTVVAISGGLRLYVAFLLVGRKPDIALSLASVFIVYATYTLDRAIKHKEDEINRKEEENANRNLVILTACVSSFAAILILVTHGIFSLIVVFPFAMGFIYSKGIRVGRFSLNLKQHLGSKNFFVAFIWAFTISALVFPAESMSLIFIFIFFFIKSFINTVIFDCKDITGDSLAGLKTFPVHFGETKTRAILIIIHSVFHLSMITLTIFYNFKFELSILFYSCVAGIFCIFLYANRKRKMFRSMIVHGEWAHLIMFRSLANQLS